MPLLRELKKNSKNLTPWESQLPVSLDNEISKGIPTHLLERMNWKQLRVRQREKAQIKSFASNEHYVVQEPSIMWSINLVPVESIVVAQPCVLNWRVLRFDEHYSLRLCVLAKHCSPSTMCTCWALLSFDQFFVCMFCIFSFFLFLRLNRRWFSRS